MSCFLEQTRATYSRYCGCHGGRRRECNSHVITKAAFQIPRLSSYHHHHRRHCHGRCQRGHAHFDVEYCESPFVQVDIRSDSRRMEYERFLSTIRALPPFWRLNLLMNNRWNGFKTQQERLDHLSADIICFQGRFTSAAAPHELTSDRDEILSQGPH